MNASSKVAATDHAPSAARTGPAGAIPPASADPSTNVRASDPATSHHAAALDRSTLAARVRDALAAHPSGLTDWETTALLGLPDRRKPSVVKRRQDAGAVPVLDDDGEPITRLSPDGHPCVAWRLP